MNYVLYGEEQYELQNALHSIMKQHHIDEQDMNFVRYDALQTTIEAIMEDALTIPFFGDEKIIHIINANFLSTNNDTDIDTKVLEQYLDHPMESTILIFSGNYEKLDARKKIVKKMQKSCKVLQFHRLDALGKENYIKEEIQRRHLHIDAIAVQELITRLPLDMRTIKQEMDKLALYGEHITKVIVEDLVTRPLEEDVFQLVNAVVQQNMKDAFSIWQDLCIQNKDAIYLIALLASQFRFLYQVKVLMNLSMGKDQIVAKLSAHPYRVSLTMTTARTLAMDRLLTILAKLSLLDQQLKSGTIDKKLGFELFLLGLQGE